MRDRPGTAKLLPGGPFLFQEQISAVDRNEFNLYESAVVQGNGAPVSKRFKQNDKMK
jgi:hypothetical protein